MQVPYDWLLEWVDGPEDPGEAAATLTRQGLSVERISRVGEGLEGVLAARVTGLTPLGDALRRAEIEAGGRRAVVATGAPNVRLGGLYAWAPPGAMLPDGQRLESATFMGQVSEGMLLSAAEMGVGPDGSGLLELDGAKPGDDVASALGLPLTVLEIELTPNVAVFCQSMAGIAAELAAGMDMPAGLPDPKRTVPSGTSFEGEVAGAAIAPQYLLASLTAEEPPVTPLWMKLRLWAAGMRSVNGFVDVTNYVMLETGQPLHAFDAALLDEPIGVRLARGGESLVTLDHVRRTLDATDIVIADRNRPIALAGVMGGEETEIGPRTRRVLIEAAVFDPLSVRRTARRHGISSEAAQRFEKGIDPERVASSLARAVDLLEDMGAKSGGLAFRWQSDLPAPRIISMRPGAVSNLLGMEVPDGETIRLLGRLGFRASPADGGVTVEVPLRRHDVAGEADLVEEVGRLIGLDRLPETPLPATAPGRRLTADVLAERLRGQLSGAGLLEHWGSSFVSKTAAGSVAEGAVALVNPLSVEEGTLRPALVLGLLDAVALNVSRHEEDVRLFEIGTVYRSGDPRPVEERMVGAVLSGRWPSGWAQAPGDVTFFDMKGILEATADALGIPLAIVPPAAPRPFLHPGRQAEVRAGGRPAGWIGEVHPDLTDERGTGRVEAFEVSLEVLRRSLARPSFSAVGRYPAVERDLAVVVDETVPYAGVEEAIRQSGARWLEEVRLFDLYRGEQVGPGKKSLAFHLAFRSEDRTLSETEVESAMARIQSGLVALGGIFRA